MISKRFQQYSMISLMVFSTFSYADNITGRVVGVSDGDTITILDKDNQQHKIRLTGIDAPEKTQAYGQASKASLSSLIYRQVVSVDYNKEDRYNRKLGKVLLGANDINLEQIRRGYAWHYKQYQNTQSPSDRQTYATTELMAISARQGLWADSKPIPPWNFRRYEKTQKNQAN